ncbi:MAG: GNAT family protein [Anderseniella sp.]
MRGNTANQPGAKPAGKPVLLETEKFMLRSLKPSDAGPTLASWFTDPLVLDGLNLPREGLTREQVRGYVAKFDNRRRYMVGIFAKPEQRFVGFYQMDLVPEHRFAQISFVLGDKDYRGKPPANEPSISLVKEFFENRNIDKIVARVKARNISALWMMKQSIFEFEAVLKQEMLLPGGGRSDVVQFRCLKDQWIN